MTPKQATMLDFIREYIDAHDYSPSYEEIKIGVGLLSKSGVHRTIEQLVLQGKIRRTFGRNRSLEVVGHRSAGSLADQAAMLADIIVDKLVQHRMAYNALDPDSARRIIVEVLRA